jgi:chemotaxis protein methyltransferase CheR
VGCRPPANLSMKSSDLQEAQRFRDVISRSLGLHFDETKLPFLSEQLMSRSQSNRQSNEDYLTQWERGVPQDEVRALAPALTVAETYFFRNNQQFRVLRELALPERWQAQIGPKRLRVLSAGCASGEEAYSIAITAREVLGEAAREVSIDAVDLNPSILERARRARYHSWALRDTSPALQNRWFQADSHGGFFLDPSIRELVSFDEANLNDQDAKLWCAGPYDIVFCRNVLMYFAPAAMQAAVKRLARILTPGGYLFLGHAETLRGISQDFHLCHTHDTFYYRVKERLGGDCPSASEALGGAAFPGTGVEDRGRQPSPGAQPTDSWCDVIQKATERVRSLTSAGRSLAASASCGNTLPLALDLLQQEHYDQALALIQVLPAESASDADVQLLHAVLLTHRLRLDEAEAMCRTLLANDELNAGAYYLLALCRERAGDRERAVEHDRYAIYLDPAFAMPRLHLGLLARRNHDLELARRELAQAHILLQREDASRLLLFGGGFNRETLLTLCRSELHACGGRA